MRAIEHSQLHRLVGVHIVDQLRTGSLPGRPPERKTILDHPLTERFADHRPGVRQGSVFINAHPVLIGSRRHDAVDHGIREGDLLGNEAARARIKQLGETHNNALCRVAVFGKIVAAKHREGR